MELFLAYVVVFTCECSDSDSCNYTDFVVFNEVEGDFNEVVGVAWHCSCVVWCFGCVVHFLLP